MSYEKLWWNVTPWIRSFRDSLHICIKFLCCVRFAETKEASDWADVKDGPGDPRREGAGEADQSIPYLGFQVLSEPCWNPGWLWPKENSGHQTGNQQAGGKTQFSAAPHVHVVWIHSFVFVWSGFRWNSAGCAHRRGGGCALWPRHQQYRLQESPYWLFGAIWLP